MSNTLALIALIEILIANRGKIEKVDALERWECELEGSIRRLTLDLDEGLCSFVYRYGGSGLADYLDTFNETYAELNGTYERFPVPSEDGTDCGRRYMGADGCEIWQTGGYAENRWKYLDWLHNQLLEEIINQK